MQRLNFILKLPCPEMKHVSIFKRKSLLVFLFPGGLCTRSLGFLIPFPSRTHSWAAPGTWHRWGIGNVDLGSVGLGSVAGP